MVDELMNPPSVIEICFKDNQKYIPIWWMHQHNECGIVKWKTNSMLYVFI